MKVSCRFFLFISVLFAAINTAEAAPCTNNNWQPTFVHDLDSPDGPWYVTPAGDFLKLRIVDNWNWTPHACDLIGQSGIRDLDGYTNCQEYTRVQCGCQRGVSAGNSTCARFLAGHNRPFPTLPYITAETSPSDVMRQSDPVMRNNQCRCEDWDNNGLFGVVLGREVVSDNYGNYWQCMDYADTLEACTAPDVMRHSDPIMDGGIVARITRLHPCEYRSGGRPSHSNHTCKVEYTLLNTTDKSIAFSSGFTETEHIWDGSIHHGSPGYRGDLRPGKTTKLVGACNVHHGKTSGSWRAGGAGFYRGEANRNRFEWSLQTRCGI